MGWFFSSDFGNFKSIVIQKINENQGSMGIQDHPYVIGMKPIKKESGFVGTIILKRKSLANGSGDHHKFTHV
jgi:hypothetical protein